MKIRNRSLKKVYEPGREIWNKTRGSAHIGRKIKIIWNVVHTKEITRVERTLSWGLNSKIDREKRTPGKPASEAHDQFRSPEGYWV